MAPNVVVAASIIKHVFEACRDSQAFDQRPEELVGALFYRFATVRSHVLLIERMIDYGSNTQANQRSGRRGR
jgi:hypothetical protein